LTRASLDEFSRTDIRGSDVRSDDPELQKARAPGVEVVDRLLKGVRFRTP
jgi:hypothetical protein